MRALLALVVAAVRWRRWSSLGLLVAAALAFATAAVAPLWANAAEDSLVTRTLMEAGPADRAVVVTSLANTDELGEERVPAVAVEEVRRASRMPPGLGLAFGPAQVSLATRYRVAVVFGGERVLAPLTWHAGGCARLTLVRGRCPRRDKEVVVSDRTAAVLGAKQGDVVTLPELAIEPVVAGSGEPFPQRFRVVGVFHPPAADEEFWSGSGAFDFTPASTSLTTPWLARGDAVFGTSSLLTRLADTQVQAQARRGLTSSTPTADEVDAVTRDLSAWAGQLRSAVGVVALDAPALETLTGLGAERDAVRLASFLLGLQLLVLAWHVLFLLIADAAEARSADLALAKLRGLQTRQVALLGVGEPAVLVLVAAPLGVLLAGLVTRLASTVFLPGRVGLRPDISVGLGVLVALAGAWLAAALGMWRTLRQPVLDQLRAAAPPTSARRLLAGEVVVVTLAAAALYQVWARRGAVGLSGLALLAPGLAAVAVAVLAGRLVQAVSVPWARATRRRKNVAAFLASRQLARRAGASSVAVLVTVAVSLAAFAASSWEIAGRQRSAQAAMEVGASSVYRVEAGSAAGLLRAVRATDPSGRQLAAVVQLPGTDTRPALLAVDTPRLAAVVDWRPGWDESSPGDLAVRLRPPAASSLVVRGRRLAVTVDAALARQAPDVALLATVTDPDGQEGAAAFGRVRFGRQTLTAQVEQCARGCRVGGFGLVRRHGETGALLGRLDFRGLSVDGRPVADAFADRAAWRPARINPDRATSTTVSTVEAAPVGVRMRLTAGPSQQPSMLRADVPEALPVLVAGGTTLEPIGRGGLVLAPMLSGGLAPGGIASRVAVLPRLGPTGVLADLELATRLGPVVDADASYQVWAGPGAPNRQMLTDRLRAAGVRVLGSEGEEERVAALGRSGPALALLLLLGVAVAALLLAALAVVAAALFRARRRAVEVAALRTAGVPDRTLRRAVVLEYAVQLGVGGLCGLATGAGAASLVAPGLAVLGLPGPLAPASDSPTAAALTGAGVVSLGLLGLVTLLCARVAVRFSRPEVLRQAAV